MEFLKEALGDELYAQVSEKLKGSQVRIADLSKGEYVAVDKLSAAETKASEIEIQLKEANKQIEAFKGMDIEGIKKAADDWKIKYDADLKAANEKMANIEYDSILRDSLSDIKFSSELAKRAAFNELKSKGLKRDNDKILGLEDAIKVLKETDKGAFVTDTSEPQQQQPLPNGMRLHQPEGSKATGGAALNPFSKEHFNLQAQTEVYRNNPQLARNMAATVGIKLL